MDFNELKGLVTSMFPRHRDEKQQEYDFWVENSLEYLHGVNYEKAWEEIKLYDGMARRPKFSFFKGISGKTYETSSIHRYYRCNNCKAELSESSQGGCPHCHSTDCDHFYTEKNVNVTVCQSACFNCELYTSSIMCAVCADYATPAYRSCNKQQSCPGRTCSWCR